VIENWRPALADGPSAIYEKLVAALERDLAAGVLSPGARLPPQRDLAYRLGLSVGTIAKAYVLAEQRGLVTGEVGRGTYLKQLAAGPQPDRVIDLSSNIIPHGPAAGRLAAALAQIGKRRVGDDCLAYAPPHGSERVRRAAVAWLQRVANIELSWNRLAVTCGSQQAMSLAAGLLCRQGDAILCESASYAGIKSIAEQGLYRTVGVEMDDEGLLPASLEQAIAATRASVLYTVPTFQNPTGRTMRPERRAEIADIVRRHQLWVIEDDVYALFASSASRPVPLAALVPDRCFYVNGLGKSIAPGLRVGFLHSPTEEHHEAILRAIRATTYSGPSLGGLIFAQWVEDGAVYKIGDEVKLEISARAALAARMLGLDAGSAPHIWLPMSELEAARVAGRAYREGVAVTAPDLPIIDGNMISGLRVCLGVPATRQELATGLQRLKTALSAATASASLATV